MSADPELSGVGVQPGSKEKEEEEEEAASSHERGSFSQRTEMQGKSRIRSS